MLIATSTRAKNLEEFQHRPLGQSSKVLGIPTEIFYNNEEGLPKVYNETIRKHENEDWIVFIHDDVEIEDLYFQSKIADSETEVLAVAGATQFNKKSPNLAWHLAAESRENLRGEVAHFYPGRPFPEPVVATTCFGYGGRKLLTFDGVLIAVQPKALIEKDCFFDEQFMWHFYDIDFALNSYKRGVKAMLPKRPIRIIHHGLGDSMMSEEFERSQKLFQRKWCETK